MSLPPWGASGRAAFADSHLRVTSEIDLAPGEQITWTGAPDPSALFTRSDALLVPFSLVWTAFAVFWTFSAAGDGAPVFFDVIGAAFVAVGLYFVAGRFFVKAYSKRHTRYFLTTRRAIIVRARTQTAMSVAPGTSWTANDRGQRTDVIFGGGAQLTAGQPNLAMLRLYGNTGLDFLTAMGPGLPPAFYDVTDVQGIKVALQNIGRIPR